MNGIKLPNKYFSKLKENASNHLNNADKDGKIILMIKWGNPNGNHNRILQFWNMYYKMVKNGLKLCKKWGIQGLSIW